MNNAVGFTGKTGMGYVTGNLFNTLYQPEHIFAEYTAHAQQVHSEQVINDLQHRGLQCRRKGGRGDWCSMAMIGNETKN